MNRTPEQQCAQIVARSHSNFALAFRSLSADRQRAMRGLYAFCRVIDDIADEPGDLIVKREQLAQWHAWIDALPAASDPVVQELHWAVQHYQLPLQQMHELIEGVRYDLDQKSPLTWDELERYCYGVAGTVGLLCLPIFGVESTMARTDAAIALGLAFQLTNIARDIASDARTGRCYVPAEVLMRFGVSRAVLAAAAEGDVAAQQLCAPVVVALVERAERAYRAAWEQFPIATTYGMEPARIMSFCYYRILQQLRARPIRTFRCRVSIGMCDKLRVLLRALCGRGWLGLWFT